MRVSACKCCGESINAGERGPLPEKCGPCMGRRRFNGPPLPKRGRPLKRPEERIRSDRFTFVPGRVESSCKTCGRTLWLFRKEAGAYQEHFCNRKCKDARPSNAIALEFCCMVCRKNYTINRIPKKGKHAGIFCSRACSFVEKGWNKDFNHRFAEWMRGEVEQRTCNSCGSSFSSPMTSGVWRCVECRIGSGGRFTRLHQVRLLSRCRDCGRVVSRDGRKRFCDTCSNSRKAKQRSKHRGGRDHRKRCRHFGVRWDSSVRMRLVLERDKYTCAICKKPTLKKFTIVGGKVHPRSPTVDHIIPLSMRIKGHTWCNVQCACWRCNVEKRDSIRGDQMRLF